MPLTIYLRRIVHYLVLPALLLIGCLAGASYWLLCTTQGVSWLSQFAPQVTDGQLTITPGEGNLLGSLAIAELRWVSPDLQISARQIQWDWSPSLLRDKKLQINQLHIGELEINSPASSQTTPAPTDLTLPFTIAANDIQIAHLKYGSAFRLDNFRGKFNSDGQTHNLADLQLQTSGIELQANASLNGIAPFALSANGQVSGKVEAHPLAISLSASGPLANLLISAQATEGVLGKAEISLTPFAATAFSRLEVSLGEIDLPTWLAGAPKAKIDLNASFTPKDQGVIGNFQLTNKTPAAFDQQALPLETLSGRIDWQGEIATFEDLRAKLSGNGLLQGSGQWKNEQLDLSLSAQQINALKLVTVLRWTALNGQISAHLNAKQQTLALDLSDPNFKLLAEVSHQDKTINIANLALSAGSAKLTAQGRLSLDTGMAFDTVGELSKFDPSLFAKTPPAKINARFKAQGKIEPTPNIEGEFELRDSLFAGQALTGKGELSINWPLIQKANIELSAGSNKLTAKGAFGRPQDVLAILIDAPKLAPYGFEGNLNGHLNLAGNAQYPKIDAQLKSDKLKLPGLGRLTGLNLNAKVADTPSSPLSIVLQIDQFDGIDQAKLAQQFRLNATGSNQAHQIKASVETLNKTQIELSLEGGLSKWKNQEMAWQGRLLEAKVRDSQSLIKLQLNTPTPLQLAIDHWQIGPAQLSGNQDDWHATLQAEANQKQLKANLSAQGKRLGKVSSDFSATMQSPWSVHRQKSWQAHLAIDTPDLSWLSEFIGEEWQTAGHFNGQLSLSGSPDAPTTSGRFRGHELTIRLPAQGLNLNQGELIVDLDRNVLDIKKLAFESQLQAPPRALRLGTKNDIEKLTKQPGTLEISGKMTVDRSTGPEQAYLDVMLDRIGAMQLSDQWLLVSGKGRLTWQDGVFGAKGKLGIDAGYWALADITGPRLSDDVVIKRSGEQAPPSNFRPKLDLDLSADLGKNFLFSGAGLSARLVGDVRLQATGHEAPRATGAIRTSDGLFDAYGQRLQIERGILTFRGVLDNPALDVRAIRKGLSVEPGVQIGGTAQSPVIKLISDPELPDTEKLAWLILGHGPEQMSAGDATVLLSAAGGLLGNNAGGIINQLKNKFGIDEFGVRDGNISDTGGRQPTSRVAGGSDTLSTTGNQIFSVGKRLSSNTLLSYEQTLGKAESVVKLTVNLTRQISFVGRAGSDNALDMFYTLTFGSPKKQTSRNKN